MQIKSTILALAAASLAEAQLSLSQQCTGAFVQLISNSTVSSCLALPALAPIASLGANASIVEPIANFEASFCAAQDCSNSTVTSVVSSLLSACSSDLSNAGLSISSDLEQKILNIAPGVFKVAKEVICLANATTSTNSSSSTSCTDGKSFCLADTLQNIQVDVGQPLSISYLVSSVMSIVNGGGATVLSSISPGTICTNCVKGAYNVIAEAYPAVANLNVGGSTLPALVEQTCGTAFASQTGLPSDVESYTTYCPNTTSSTLTARYLARWA